MGLPRPYLPREPAGAPALRSGVPEGSSGDWILERFEVRTPAPGRAESRAEWAVSPPGTYTRLRRGNQVFMTDLVDELWTQRTAVAEASTRGGRVLLTGLGLGLVAEAMLMAPGQGIESITIVEASEDVISLVGPYLQGRHPGYIEVVHASAFQWEPSPGSRFTVGWHDIWDNPRAVGCEEEEAELLERFNALCDWQGTWPARWRLDEVDTARRRSRHAG